MQHAINSKTIIKNSDDLFFRKQGDPIMKNKENA